LKFFVDYQAVLRGDGVPKGVLTDAKFDTHSGTAVRFGAQFETVGNPSGRE
jgi:hypothetical protein